MITEGSVVASTNAPKGEAVNVAPEGLGHPVYRSGFALSLSLPALDFSAIPEEAAPVETELEQALFAAMRTAAEEAVVSIAEESAQQETAEFEKAEQELAESEPAAPIRAPVATPEPLLLPPPAEEPPEPSELQQEPPAGKEDEPGHEL
jgi:hypothetical protein